MGREGDSSLVRPCASHKVVLSSGSSGAAGDSAGVAAPVSFGAVTADGSEHEPLPSCADRACLLSPRQRAKA